MQIAEGLRDIHDANLSHVDLNSHNVVIDEHNNAFIIDLSRSVRTYGWCAPEAWVETDPLDLPLGLTQRADIYSLDVVLWELATGHEVAIPIGMDHEGFFRIEDGSVPKEYEQMIQRCMKCMPGDRPGIGEIIEMLEKLRSDSSCMRQECTTSVLSLSQSGPIRKTDIFGDGVGPDRQEIEPDGSKKSLDRPIGD